MTWRDLRGSSRRVLACIAALACLALGAVAVTVFKAPGAVSSPAASFVTSSGDELTLNGKVFRFAGSNIYWGGLDENGRTGTNYPTPFRVQAALETAADMGETVVRCQTCGISTGSSFTVEPSLGTFSQAAFQHIDYFIAQAAKYGIKLVIPLANNYTYYLGGYCDFTNWLDLSTAADCPSPAAATAFYTNPRAIAAFEQYISVVLNHVNFYTGLPNKDNPTIMAWETGNELPYGLGGAPEFTRWTAKISAYIKSLAPHQLVMDGALTVDPGDMKLPDVDIVDLHQYPISIAQLNQVASAAAAAKRVLVIGEYGWNNWSPTGGLSPFLADVDRTKSIAGDLYWDLFPQNDLFGYVEHFDGFQLHFPGDNTDVGADGTIPVQAATSDAPLVSELRIHAYAMSGRTVPAYPVPGVPVITNVEHVASQTAGTGNLVEWRGVPGAASYVVKRSATGASGPWTTVGTVSAAATEAPYLDRGAVRGVWYQVVAVNPSGRAGSPSASFRFVDQTLDDNLENLVHTVGHTPGIYIDKSNATLYGGDADRADFPAGAATLSITWSVPGLQTFEATACYSSFGAVHFTFMLSTNYSSWTLIPAMDVQSNEPTGTSLTDALCYIYTIHNAQAILKGASYIQVVRAGNASGTAELNEARATYP